MKLSPDFWATYAHLQARLDARNVIDDASWGLEAGLDHLTSSTEQPVAEEDLARLCRSKSRRERYRATLRRVSAMGASVLYEAEPTLDARRRLVMVRRRATEDEVALLLAVDAGVEYEDLAPALGVSVGCLRTRVCRLRSKLRNSLGDEGMGPARLVVWLAAA